MTLPTTPLALTLDAQALTLDDLELFEPNAFSVRAFKAFMARHSNWTAADVGGLTVQEMPAVIAQIGAAMKGAAIPKAT